MRLLAQMAREGSIEYNTAAQILRTLGRELPTGTGPHDLPEISREQAVEAYRIAMDRQGLPAETLQQIGRRLLASYGASLGHVDRSNGVSLESIQHMAAAVGDILAGILVDDLGRGPLSSRRVYGDETMGALDEQLRNKAAAGERGAVARIIENMAASVVANNLEFQTDKPVVQGTPTLNLMQYFATTFWTNVPWAGLDAKDVAGPTMDIQTALWRKVPGEVSGRYALSVSAGGEFVANPIKAAGTGLRSVSGTQTAEGGWSLKAESGPFTQGAWQTKRLSDLVTGEKLRELMDQGFNVYRERDIFVAQAGDGKDPIVFAFRQEDEAAPSGMSGDLGRLMNMMGGGNTLGMVSICQDVQVWDMDGNGCGQVFVRKPVIYLYPTRRMEVTVDVRIDGEIVAEYPKRKDGVWTVTAEPNGKMRIEGSERSYPYLFWEGVKATPFQIDPAQAHCIPGSEASAFLEYAADRFGLNDQERTDFVSYWVAALEMNELNLIQFLDPAEYGRYAEMSISPRPDTVIRLFMVFQAVDRRIAAGAPELPSLERRGFTVVEWGGVNLDERR